MLLMAKVWSPLEEGERGGRGDKKERERREGK